MVRHGAKMVQLIQSLPFRQRRWARVINPPEIRQPALKGTLFRRLKPIIVQGLCESRGGRPGLSVLTSLLVSVDVKLY